MLRNNRRRLAIFTLFRSVSLARLNKPRRETALKMTTSGTGKTLADNNLKWNYSPAWTEFLGFYSICQVDFNQSWLYLASTDRTTYI